MSRQSHSISNVVDIPENVTSEAVVAALYDHSGIMSLQSLITASRPVQPEDAFTENISSSEKAHFNDASITDLSHYEVDETLTIVPDIGELGKRYISFPARWQNTPNGYRGWAHTPDGVTVASEWTVRRQEGTSEGLVLEGKATVECSIFLMPFVRRSFEPAQRNLAQRIVDEVKKSSGGKEQ